MAASTRRTVLAGLAAILLAAACGGETADPCASVGCSSRGFCLADQGTAYCACLSGYHPVGLECVANDPSDPCAGIDCSGHGSCRVEADRPACDCAAGYRNPDPASAACATGGCELLCVRSTSPDGGGDADADSDADADADAGGDVDADADAEADSPPPPPGCGDGRVEGSEECDDGNRTPLDGCENDCTASCHDAGECDDGNPCTTDRCDPLGGGAALCGRSPNDGATCDDGLFCTTSDRCLGEICVGSGSPCPSGPCASGCDDAMGRCVFAGSGTVCREASGPCDEAERCTGSSAACPPDAHLPDGTICRDDGRLCGREKDCHVCRDGACVLNEGHWSSSCLPSCGVIESYCGVAVECCGATAVCPWGEPGGESNDCGGRCCAGACCYPSEPIEWTCDDHGDNDCDLAADCDDTDCEGRTCESGGGVCRFGVCIYVP